jgi:hypothetical protein
MALTSHRDTLSPELIGFLFRAFHAKEYRLRRTFIVARGLNQPPKMGDCTALVALAFFNMPNLYRCRSEYKFIDPEKYHPADQISQDRSPQTRPHLPDHQPQNRSAQLPPEQIKQKPFHSVKFLLFIISAAFKRQIRA